MQEKSFQEAIDHGPNHALSYVYAIPIEAKGICICLRAEYGPLLQMAKLFQGQMRNAH